MCNKELIANLTIENNKLKKLTEDYKDVLDGIRSSFYSIGGPLNDNKLQFNYKQLVYLNKISQQIKAVL